MSVEIILIAGLPGSGKTTYMEARQREGWSIFDDFKANAFNDSSVFWHSRNYEAYPWRCAKPAMSRRGNRLLQGQLSA